MKIYFHIAIVSLELSNYSTFCSIPLYAFTYSKQKGLNLVDLNGMKVVAKLDDGDDLTKYAYLTRAVAQAKH